MELYFGYTIPRQSNQGRIVTVGMFDGVHLGHRHLLQSLLAKCTCSGQKSLVVTFVRHPLHVISPSKPELRYITTLSERLLQLEEAGVDECLLLDFDSRLMSMSAREFMRLLRDNYNVKSIVLGFNNKFGNNPALTIDDYKKIASEENMELSGASQYEIDNKSYTVCSSAIRRLIADDGDVAKAAEMLGRPYALSGLVVHGKAIGRTIGFPTANVLPDNPGKILPAKGVYACQAILADKKGMILPAMVNIGDCPTFDDGRKHSVEAHIIGLDSDIYDMPLTLRFLQRVRAERRFASLQELSEQLSTDRKITLEINSNTYLS